MMIRTGTVTEFDDPRGLGVVTDSGGREYPFHCTAIADGTRQIAVGTAVCFVDRPRHRGCVEATDITGFAAQP